MVRESTGPWPAVPADEPDCEPGGGGALDLPRALRPRQKLFARGPRALSPSELVALVLGGGTRSEQVARRLLRRHGLAGLSRMGPTAWRGEVGLGVVAAARMTAAFELGRLAHGRSDDDRPRVGSPGEAFRQVKSLGRARKEHLVGLYLDAQNALLSRETISIGSLNTTRTHPREVLYPAIRHLALGFILAHNHPSGCLDPSAQDVEFTRSIRQAAELMGFELYDHLVVTRSGYTSFRERGLL
ncbi:MAG TPA: DNA repair protein RadC [Candidatus Polarisedimenticolaceae bacterium]|nr:DNA repair protein RadC [Candidatus Polarisedimenticolaceae bacterium]